MKFRQLCLTTLATAGAAFAGSQAGATSYVQLGLEDLVAQSSLIVEGSVQSASIANTADGVFTTTVVRVSDGIVGKSGSTVTVVTPGGRFTSGKFKLAEINAGAVALARGENVILFLGNQTAAGYPLVGEAQGMLNVEQTSKGAMVRSPGARSVAISTSTLKSKIRAMKASPSKSGAGKGLKLER